MSKVSMKVQNILEIQKIIEEYNDFLLRLEIIGEDTFPYQKKTFNQERYQKMTPRRIILELQALKGIYCNLEKKYLMHFLGYNSALNEYTIGEIHHMQVDLEEFLLLVRLYQELTHQQLFKIPYPQDFQLHLPRLQKMTVQELKKYMETEKIYPLNPYINQMPAIDLWETYKEICQSKNKQYYNLYEESESQEEFLSEEELMTSYGQEIEDIRKINRRKESNA